MIVPMDDLACVRESAYFNAQWYQDKYPDVPLSGVDPALHFLKFGALLERDPGPSFQTRKYLDENPGCRDAGVNPLVHLRRSEFYQSKAAAKKRVAVFAAFSVDGAVTERVLHYLKGLRAVADCIVAVYDNDLIDEEALKLSGLADHVIAMRHGEYDFGSYKRGMLWLERAGHLESSSQLILCNDSCYGPLGSFVPMVSDMDARGYDFWGMTDSNQFSYHLQSYFISLGRKVFRSAPFRRFILSVTKQPSVAEVIMKYELGLTRSLVNAGFSVGAFIKNEMVGVHKKDNSYQNITIFPMYSIQRGAPLLKVKALRHPTCNMDGINATLKWLKENSVGIYDIATMDIDVAKYLDSDKVGFSIVLPTFNRAWCIQRAIDSVLAQTHRRFELIIVDDGSDDGTEGMVAERYAEALADGRIRYVSMPGNFGVCAARNVGLSLARYDWIAYMDSDNNMRPYFLSVYADAIIANRDYRCFYSRFINLVSGAVVGAPFDYARLVQGNFIDLGVFVHHKCILTDVGGFDSGLKRLVDWDFILRATKKWAPFFIHQTLLEYSDREDDGRISRKESYLRAKVSVLSRHGAAPTVTTAIVSYNQREYIAEAIESALSQRGNLIHEIVVSDDGSDDGTAEIIARYAAKFPDRIRDISRRGNFGISSNYQHCFECAAGNYVAILEADDFWTDPDKNLRQAEFLERNPKAAMVFSRIELLDVRTGCTRVLRRQEGLSTDLLSGKEFSENEHLNLIANFSSAMFRKDLMRRLPSMIYDPRINEICLAFYFDRIGMKIGFIDRVMGTYRVGSSGVWQGAAVESKLQQAIQIRRRALGIAATKYRPAISKALAVKYAELRRVQRAK